MKTKQKTIGVLLIGILTSVLFGFTLLQSNGSDFLIGIWLPAGSDNSSWEFTSEGKCYQYYTGEETEVYIFSIEATSPQCDFEVEEGPNYSYLKLVNIINNSDVYCYEILTLSSDKLQIRLLGTGYVSNFYKR